MSSAPSPKHNTPEEVDLLEFLKKAIGSLFRAVTGIVKLIVRLIIYCFRKWWQLSLSVVVGLLIAYGVGNALGDVYQSELILRSNSISVTEMASHVDQLGQILAGKDYDRLGSILGLSNEKVKDLKKVETFWVIDINKDWTADYIDFSRKHNISDTVNVRMNDRFAIRIKTKSGGDYSEIQDGIIKYISQNPLFIEQNRLRHSQINKLLSRIDYDISQLDSLQKVKYFEEARGSSRQEGSQIVFMQEHDTQLIYEEIYQLYEDRQAYERELTLFPGVCSIQQAFTPASRPVKGTLFYAYIIVPIVFLAALLMLLIFDYRKDIIDWTATL